MATIVDYSAGYPGAGPIERAGHKGVIRYLRKEGQSRVKPITFNEYQDMRRAGLDVAFVYQHVDRSRVLNGRAAGRYDATWALAQCQAIGVTPRAIYFAVDFDAQPNQFGAIGEYMRGAADVLGKNRVGTYGKYALLQFLFDNGRITYGWQTYAWSPGHNKDPRTFEPRAHLFQRLGTPSINGIPVDVNTILKADYGQQNFTTPPSEEDDMTPEESKLLKDTAAAVKVIGARVEHLWSRYRQGETGVQSAGVYAGYIGATKGGVDEIVATLVELEAAIEGIRGHLSALTGDGLNVVADGQITVRVQP